MYSKIKLLSIAGTRDVRNTNHKRAIKYRTVNHSIRVDLRVYTAHKTEVLYFKALFRRQNSCRLLFIIVTVMKRVFDGRSVRLD